MDLHTRRHGNLEWKCETCSSSPSGAGRTSREELPFSASSPSAAGQQLSPPAGTPTLPQHVHEEGPPLSLRVAVDEALTRNLDLAALLSRASAGSFG